MGKEIITIDINKFECDFANHYSKYIIADIMAILRNSKVSKSDFDVVVKTKIAEEIFCDIEKQLEQKYRNWKLLINKRLQTIGYKRAYLDVKKIHKKYLSNFI